MRKLLVLLLLWLCSFSCEIDCIPDVLVYSWVGFEPEEVDTVVIRRFEPGTIGGTALDSIVAGENDFGFSDPAADTLRFSYSQSGIYLNPDYDYQLWLPGAGRSFNISEIYQKEGTRDFGCMNKRQCTYPIEHAKVNGVETKVYYSNNIYLVR